jgi:hypothetical protein
LRERRTTRCGRVIRHVDAVFATLIAHIHATTATSSFQRRRCHLLVDDGVADAAARGLAAAARLQSAMALMSAVTTPAA